MGETSARRIRAGATLATVAVAIAAAVLSWSGLTHLAVSVSVSSRIAWLFPVAVDGAMLAGSLTALQAALRAHKAVFPWLVVMFGAAISVYGNIRSVPEGSVDSAIVHGAAPLLLLASLELLFGLIRQGIKAGPAVAESAVSFVADTPAVAASTPSPNVRPAAVVTPVRVPSVAVEVAQPILPKKVALAKPKPVVDGDREVLKEQVLELRALEPPLSYGKISEELAVP